MKTAEVIIIGGGPAGSSCAWRLKHHDIDCLLLDSETFPRLKLCAGWITPEVISDLEIDIPNYPHSFMTFDGIRVHLYGMGFRLNSQQHSIRRYEFDAWLLQRSGVSVVQHDAKKIEYNNGYYIIDDSYRCRYLIGAGGTRCPVARQLFRAQQPRDKALQAVTLEQEFAYDWQDGDCHLWFFDKRLPGYSWYVPKAGGYINVGIGAMAAKLRQRNSDIKQHWQRLTDALARKGLISRHSYQARGYSYYLRADNEVVRNRNAFIVGDAAGLATRDLCEGIGAAVRSGLLAADAIASNSEYHLETIARHSADSALAHKWLEFMLV